MRRSSTASRFSFSGRRSERRRMASASKGPESHQRTSSPRNATRAASTVARSAPTDRRSATGADDPTHASDSADACVGCATGCCVLLRGRNQPIAALRAFPASLHNVHQLVGIDGSLRRVLATRLSIRTDGNECSSAAHLLDTLTPPRRSRRGGCQGPVLLFRGARRLRVPSWPWRARVGRSTRRFFSQV